MATYGDIIGGSVKYPEVWGRNTTYLHDSNKTVIFTAPKRGWYKFHVIGDGGTSGNQGFLLTLASYYKNSYKVAGGSSSGSTGAYAIHEALLRKGGTVTITMNTSQIQVDITASNAKEGAGRIVAKHGVEGLGTKSSNGGSTFYGVGGIAADASSVTASGGNIANLSGVKGNNGDAGGLWYGVDDQGYNIRYGQYGAYAPVQSDPRAIYTPKVSLRGGMGYSWRTHWGDRSEWGAGQGVRITSTNTSLGGAEPGLGGSVIWADDEKKEWKMLRRVDQEFGYGGGVGGVVIESGV